MAVTALDSQISALQAAQRSGGIANRSSAAQPRYGDSADLICRMPAGTLPRKYMHG